MAAADFLLVEDDPADLELTLRVLRKQFNPDAIHVARDGAEALDLLTGSNESGPDRRFRCILLDLKLPKVDGLEVLRVIKTNPALKSIPVVVLTSSREAPDLKAAYEIGANSYLCKPVKLKDFDEVVRQIGLYWMLINESPD